LVILGLIIAAALLRRWVRRSSASAGKRAGARYTAERTKEIVDALGVTVVIHAPEAVAAELVHRAVATRSKDFHLRPDGAIGIRFLEPDDTIVRLLPGPTETLLRIDTFRDYLGSPQTAPLWQDLRALVRTEAAARRIAVSEGPVSPFERGALLDDRNARWFRREGTAPQMGGHDSPPTQLG
ncbi:hypothetical protein, partial [Mycobacterium tuberculosis]|uniref:hypothetical protein n=1 Tax=Mycobacterium tuberculosis TaxID=1773 RepID=UPI00067CE62F